MKNTDKFILLILAFGAIWLLLTYDNVKKPNISLDELYNKVIQNNRFVSPEKVAVSIISKDPVLQLIDVRDSISFNNFTLVGSINIPLKDLLKKSNLAYFDQDVYNTVIFSNGSSDAIVAWELLTRLGYKNISILEGGVNAWFDELIFPQPSEGPWDKEADENYQFRKGVRQYFGGGSTSNSDETSAPKTKKPLVKHKKKEVTGGCG